MKNIIFTIAAGSDINDGLVLLETAGQYTEEMERAIIVLDWPEKIVKNSFPKNINLITLDDLFPRDAWIEQAFQLTEAEFKTFVRPYAFEYFSKKHYSGSLYIDSKCIFLTRANYLLEKIKSANAIILSSSINSDNFKIDIVAFKNSLLYLKFDPINLKFIQFWKNNILSSDLTLDKIFQAIPIYLAGTIILHTPLLCCDAKNWNQKYHAEPIELFDFSHHANQSAAPLKKVQKSTFTPIISKKYAFSTYMNGSSILFKQRCLYRFLHPYQKSEIKNPFEACDRFRKIENENKFLDRNMLKNVYKFDLDQLLNYAVISSITYRTGHFILSPFKWLFKICKKSKLN